MRSSPTCVVVLALTMLLGSLDSSAATPQPRSPLVQSVDIQIPSPPMPVTIAGRKHLAYELHITNFRPFDVELLQVEIFDAGNSNLLARFSDAQLAQQLARVGPRAEGSERRRVVAGGRTILYVWLPLDAGTPVKLEHGIEFAVLRPSGRERASVANVSCQVRNEQPLVLTAPVRGGPWVALYDPMMIGGHRTSIYTFDGRARIPARFAIDWVKLADDATHAHGDASVSANWHGYGSEVLAVADGTIIDAADDLSEGATISAATGQIALENASGNYVILDLGRGRYAFYEHLKHGSIKVKRGDRVQRGAVIALLGNSGSSSSGPHLHFHVADAATELAAEGIPYVFDDFEVLGAYSGIETYQSGQRWQPVATGTGKRRAELPAANTVITFP
ncbi:M23 family metallopeptidase [Steroidobacter cummioxidans]|uniref:M23 family metallopeptidase n=1 Tax=Steroidobacter cummioxidans TaxID=1803913 RepID=UPI0012902B0A|nr:M23 family metallopeptidase [Steroidobacter cummioxidans]